MSRPHAVRSWTWGMVMMGVLASCQPEQAAVAARTGSLGGPSDAGIVPRESGFLEVNGLRIWHEIYGEGEPLVLLHGGLMAIPDMMPMIVPLARTRRVIALELQGHGRTADTDRPIALGTLGDDVAAVIEALGLEEADVAGYSFGADAALRAAIQHPDKVRRLVVISTAFAKNGWYPLAQEGMSAVGSGIAESLSSAHVGKLAASWPEPERFPKFLDKFGKMMAEDYDWEAEVAKLSMPVLLAYADHDSVSQQHIAAFYALLGGGIEEPGWENTKFTNVRLAVVPGYSHYDLTMAPELPGLVDKFLADPRLSR